MPSRRTLTIPLLTLCAVLACDGTPTSPGDASALRFSVDDVSLTIAGPASVTLRNVRELAVGPVELTAGPLRDAGGSVIPGAAIRVTPESVPTLAPGETVELTIELVVQSQPQPGLYAAVLAAEAGEHVAALTVVHTISQPPSEAASVELGPVPASMRQGDVVTVAASATDAGGAVLGDAPINWSVDPPQAGYVDGVSFVAYQLGPVTLVARSGTAADSVEITVETRGLSGAFLPVSTGIEETRYTSDLWVHGDHAYLGTWAFRSGVPGNTLFTWSVADPGAPVLLDSLVVDARTVNDVKVHPERPLAIITHELSEDGKNGVTLLDLSDPGEPAVVSRYTEGLEPGIHNAWLEGDYAYLVVDGIGNGLRILDVSDPARPMIVASWWAGSSFLHDVYVRDGLAFLSHWDAGLVILDVGNGVAGGSPEAPVEVSRLEELGGQTHNAWYWPAAGYVFVGEEDFGTPGRLHVVDVGDLSDPREVATFDLANDPPHNAWMDEERGVLYVAWYGEGALALDVTGELLGDLARQGRTIARSRYQGGAGSCFAGGTTCAWAPQLHGGLLYLSDRNTGLVVLEPSF